MSESRRSVRLAGGTIERSCHACAFFHSRDEEYELLLPFTREGVERGDMSFQIVDPALRRERLASLQRAGIDSESGDVEVRTWHDAYLRKGGFDQHDMLLLIQEVLQKGRQRGYTMTRLWANMEWALGDFEGTEDLVEYETRLNTVLPKYDDVVVCSYDLNRFGAGVAMDILRTHPMVVIGGLLQENPFFVEPERFLQELRQRKEVAAA